jgi:hypothetical protein
MRKALDLSSLSGGEHLATLKEIAIRIRHDYALMLDTIAELDHAQTAQFAGYATLPALLAEVLHIARGDATRMVTQATRRRRNCRRCAKPCTRAPSTPSTSTPSPG